MVVVGALLAAPAVAGGQDNQDSKYEEALKQAVRLFGDSKFRECGDALEVLVKQFPKGADAYYYLGLSRMETKQWRAAREALARYSDLSPASAEARRFIGVAYLQEGLYAEAAASLEKCLAIDPSDEEAKEYLTRSKALLRTKPDAAPVALPADASKADQTTPQAVPPNVVEPPTPGPMPGTTANGQVRPSTMAEAPRVNVIPNSPPPPGTRPSAPRAIQTRTRALTRPRTPLSTVA